MQSLQLGKLAAVGIVVGVFLHVCAFYVILGTGGGSGDSAAPLPTAATQPRTPTPQPGRLPDRLSCAEIRGTEYRSEAERQWYLRNCTGAALPSTRDGGPSG